MSRKSKAAEFVEEAYDVTVTGRNVHVTDAMKDYAIEKVSKIERFSQRIIEVNVIMDIQKIDHRVDLIAKVDNVRLKSSAASTDMYASIDKAVEKLTEQLRRYKSRVTDHHTLSHADVAMNEDIYSPLGDDLLELNDEIEAENNFQLTNTFNAHKVVSRETKPLKTLTHKEALIRMELTGDAFMLFRCEEDRKIKVIYRRDDGNFGVIEPE
jgi:putative sigma-54 modulation protein